MIGLDTSVLARYLIQDDPRQSARASELVNSAVDDGELLFVSAIVLCELVWVLESAYRYGKDAIAGVIGNILEADQMVVEDRDDARAALKSYRRGKADFSDYLIGARGHTQGCERTVTFDRALRGEEGFELLT